MSNRGVDMRESVSGLPCSGWVAGALMAVGVGASVAVGCGVATADDGSPASSAASSSPKSGSAHSKPLSHNAAANASVRGPQKKAVATGRRSTTPTAAVGSTGRQVKALTVPDATASATAAAQPSEKSTATKSASAVANPLSFFSSIARHIQVTYFNRTPTIYYDASKNVINDDGTITGQVIGSDADGDPLKYTVSTAAEG